MIDGEADKLESIGENVKALFSEVEGFVDTGKSIKGIYSGFIEIDELTSGFFPGDLIVIGGRPSIGKSSFVFDVTLHIATRQKSGAVLLFALESTKDRLTTQLASMLSGVPINRALSPGNQLTEKQYLALADACEALYKMPLLVEVRPNLTPSHILNICRKAASQREIIAIVIDSLHLMEPDKPGDNRYQEVADMCRSLKAMAKLLNLPVIVTSELSRIAEPRAPQLSDLRDAGTIEAVADVVLLLHREGFRPDFENQTEDSHYDTVEAADVYVAKQRYGRRGKVTLGYQPHYTRFRNLARD